MNQSAKKNQVRVYTCDTWEHFVSQVTKVRRMPPDDPNDKMYHFGSGVIFRGHSDTEWQLSSTIERNMFDKVVEAVDKNGKKIPFYSRRTSMLAGEYNDWCNVLITKFRENTKGMPGIDSSSNDIDLWSIGRHYGLLSPYLDWTASPFIAAFFAFEKIYKTFEHLHSHYKTIPETKVINVWGLQFWEGIENDDDFKIIPTSHTHTSRARAQQGWFTKLTSRDFVDIQSYFESIGKAYYLERYDINTETAMQALHNLSLMDINYLTLFPDAFGAALHTNINSGQFRDSLATIEVSNN